MKAGDLIFTFIGSDDNAISAVTEGFRGGRVNHMGAVVSSGSTLSVLEAYPPKVQLAELDEFIRRSHDATGQPRYMLGRLDEPNGRLIKKAISYGLKQRNVPYDYRYLTDQVALYCSELIVDMFKFANDGKEFFLETPMSFRDIFTGEPHPVWVAYYAQFGMDVPTGEPGSNPGAISLDGRLEIYDVVGAIPGYQ
ncbi:hypothetical protein G6M70_11280 [Agrobacterium tumefaciens]|uniref:YiiX/YebB-like N1pC/P60 family cysteine hydrolase n=1 Tax=Agrobacterium tumefaciens TaxID=358 RepID=UPI00157335E8|nr:YiiX/YebB-like N1pC/P60 family cysteine hydrolase [Agrobacterium tumefaciens]NSZ03172.1 hypothetical protein [Agrobacterium tumefaciens]NSZ39787.1 hypothetical protein [Agrobacterium tumefaciens]NTB26745.1 hypothetical protein [Agrobacterium tumefaciens]NTB31861.1 hypothetical protein [Agrobacterium tumefaciens]NTB34306.1 hypothetical protein [Agrobacterium tumefaciens]